MSVSPHYLRWEEGGGPMHFFGVGTSVGTSDPIFNLTWPVELNFKFFWVKALKTFQLLSRVGSKQQFWHQLFSTWVIFKFKKINFFSSQLKEKLKKLELNRMAILCCFYEVNFKPFYVNKKIARIKYFVMFEIRS